jgi:hypothetical protein
LTKPAVVNLPASVHQRLQNLRQARGVDFNSLLSAFVMERFLYRLSVSPHAQRFVLKGALLLAVWAPLDHRSTHDLDLLGFGDNSADGIARAFQDICVVPVVPDGLPFDASTLRVQDIQREEEYLGRRVRLEAWLGMAHVPLQVDVGFGDTVVPPPLEVEYPTLLDFPAPRLRAYPREAVVAEKLQAMVELGQSNGRLKDYYDVWDLSQRFGFEGALLSQSIRATFGRRNTAIPPAAPFGLSPAFAELPDKIALWAGFLSRTRLEDKPEDLAEVIECLRHFLLPILQALATERDLKARWPPGGPWAAD